MQRHLRVYVRNDLGSCCDVAHTLCLVGREGVGTCEMNEVKIVLNQIVLERVEGQLAASHGQHEWVVDKPVPYRRNVRPAKQIVDEASAVNIVSSALPRPTVPAGELKNLRRERQRIHRMEMVQWTTALSETWCCSYTSFDVLRRCLHCFHGIETPSDI